MAGATWQQILAIDARVNVKRPDKNGFSECFHLEIASLVQ
jgi:hypothetical protein